MIRSDNDIQTDVLDEFFWDPEVAAPDIGVEVDDGVVTLTGTVDRYAMKLAAERAAQRVDGVRAVANDLMVRTALTHNDTDIAKAAADALEANIAVPKGAVDVTVQNGKVTLRGEVDWAYRRYAAANSVRDLRGVRDVINLVQVKQPKVLATDVSGAIERALRRAAEIDAERIRVRTEDGHVTLTGTVRSWPEKREAGFAAWRAKGVTQVTNDIEVGPYCAIARVTPALFLLAGRVPLSVRESLSFQSSGVPPETRSMTPNSIEAFDTTIQKTNEWLRDIALELGINSRRHAYLALRGTLHAVRDFLPLEESAQFSAQLPMLVRGLYFEGWNPSDTPVKVRTRECFVSRVETALEHALRNEPDHIDAETAAQAVLRVLSDRISGGEMDQVRRVMPERIRDLWPTMSVTD
jgi:osmotically-inducible protein OsmY/uncharacterized protein (DUF2267 family)